MPHLKANQHIPVYILDDDKDLLDLIERKLVKHGIQNYRLFPDTDRFLETLNNDPFGKELTKQTVDDIVKLTIVAVIDYKLIGYEDGLEVLREVKKHNFDNFAIGYSSVTDPKVLIDYINSDIDRFIDKDKWEHLDRLIAAIEYGLLVAEARKNERQKQQISLNEPLQLLNLDYTKQLLPDKNKR